MNSSCLDQANYFAMELPLYCLPNTRRVSENVSHECCNHMDMCNAALHPKSPWRLTRLRDIHDDGVDDGVDDDDVDEGN